MKNIFAAFRARQELRSQKKKIQEHEAKEHRLKKIVDAEAKMLSTFCPIVRGKCIKTCIHFEEGKIRQECHSSDAGIHCYTVTDFPRCKLWK